MAKENDIVFIVDETRTGCGATETLWAHQSWNLK